MRPNPVAAHQVVDVGQAQGAVEEIQPAHFEAVQDVVHLGQARRQFALQVVLVGADGGFQGSRPSRHLPAARRTGSERLPAGVVDHVVRHAQRVA